MNYFERLSEPIPNKFAEDFGHYPLASPISDDNGLYTHWGCGWLVGFITFKAPHRNNSFKGATEFREMTQEEIKTHLGYIKDIYSGKDARRFVASARKKLSARH